MGDDVVLRVKSALDIVDIVSESVRLSRRGKSYTGLCPFHEEKTPSFTVSQERQSWHCFGCNRGGDLFSFVMEKEGLSFYETLVMLAKRANVTLPQREYGTKSTDLSDVLEKAAKIYSRQLHLPSGKMGLAYADRRMLDQQAIAKFNLGWAPASWSFIADELAKEGVGADLTEKAGLSIKGDRGLYDRFRGRLMFPIKNVGGRVIGFGGRLIDGEGAKYLNSPETAIYNKKDNLYLLDIAKYSIREKGRSILVEGYMDAIRLHLSGYGEAVASLGTALTTEQATLLRRFAPMSYICYDSDSAGQDAALRGMYLLQKAGLNVFVVTLDAKDPDELLTSEGGREQFEKALQEALPLVSYHIKLFNKRSDGIIRDVDGLLDGLTILSAIELAPFIQELARCVGVTDVEMRKEMDMRRKSFAKASRDRNLLDKKDETKKVEANNVEISEKVDTIDKVEAAVVSSLWDDRDLRRKLDSGELLKLIKDKRLHPIVASLLNGERPDDLHQNWLELGDTFPMALLALGSAYCETIPGEPSDRWRELVNTLIRRDKKSHYSFLHAKMLRGEASDEEMQQYFKISQELKGG